MNASQTSKFSKKQFNKDDIQELKKTVMEIQAQLMTLHKSNDKALS